MVSQHQIKAHDDAASGGNGSTKGKGKRADGADINLLDTAADGSDDEAMDRTMDLEAFIAYRWKNQPRKPSIFLVHGALVLVQVIFGIGSVVGKLGVSKFNPVLFALIREAAAGPLLVVMALFLEGWVIKICRRSTWRFAAGGIFLFANQLCYIVGEKLSSAVIGSAWQPSQVGISFCLAGCCCGLFCALQEWLQQYSSASAPPVDENCCLRSNAAFVGETYLRVF